MMKLPKPFEGEHDDMDRFIGDWNTYFEMFCHQFRGVSSLMVVFATLPICQNTPSTGGPIEGRTSGSPTITTLPVPQYRYPHHDPASPQYRYPHWDDFIREFKAMFWDPAVEEVHKKRMKEMKMSGNPATIFFHKLEHEAKLAGRCDDTDCRGMMVTAV